MRRRLGLGVICGARVAIRHLGAPWVILRAGVVVLAISACVATSSAAGAVLGSAVGIVPPHEPASNCLGVSAIGAHPLRSIDACRAREDVGPMHLPSNWGHLNAVEHTFVAIDLERVNRGLSPLPGLARTVDALAQQGANAGQDPPFPANTSGLRRAGGVWAGTGSALWSVFLWMYDDGPGRNDYNERCPRTGGPSCWGHRRLILMRRPNLIAGAGHTASSTAFEIISFSRASERPSAVAFSWSSELHFFARVPGAEPTRG